jgi:hyperosmotically inducible protein
MRNSSKIQKALFTAALIAGFGAVPFTQAVAQDAMSKSADNQTVPDKAADGWITTKVKSEFTTSKTVKATDVTVNTNDGVVTLSGTVASEKEKTHAVAIAKKVKGVKSVDASGLTVSADTAAK